MKIGSLKRKLRKWVRYVLPTRFGNRPKNLTLKNPVSLRGPNNMFFGDDVYIGPYSILKVITKTGSLMRHPKDIHVGQVFENARITFGNRVSATGNLHVASHRHVFIGDDVMLASNVFMADAQHAYANTQIPYKYQGMFQVSDIRIEQGCWIGQNVVIMPGVTIGEMAIIGANSVVTRDIPARTIAVGTPARVIKRWDELSQSWISAKVAGTTDTKKGVVGHNGHGGGASALQVPGK